VKQVRPNPVIGRLSIFMAAIAGATLLAIMLLTVLDVILRYFGRPITGIYDLVALGGSVVIGFSIPYAAHRKVHVFMEMAQVLQSRIVKAVLAIFARLIGLGITCLVGWNLVILGTGFRTTGEASLTVQIAFYPVAIGLGICFFIQGLVFVEDMYKVFSGGTNE
jgi:TRAP-type C4-dicarboxylate transport system permease small subunit